MKMQNSLAAAASGKVKAVNVKEGETVEEEQVLVELEWTGNQQLRFMYISILASGISDCVLDRTEVIHYITAMNLQSFVLSHGWISTFTELHSHRRPMWEYFFIEEAVSKL